MCLIFAGFNVCRFHRLAAIHEGFVYKDSDIKRHRTMGIIHKFKNTISANMEIHEIQTPRKLNCIWYYIHFLESNSL